MEKSKFNLSPLFCLNNQTVILSQNDYCVILGIVDDTNNLLKERLRKACAHYLYNVEFQKITPQEFKIKFSALFSIDKVKKENYFLQKNSSEYTAENNTAAALLESLIVEARNKGSTDIHIEKNIVRYRTGGLLTDKQEYSYKHCNEVVRIIKLLSKMNVMEKRHPQDGQFTYTDERKNKIFIRVSCMPSINENDENGSESVVLRLLDTTRIPLEVEQLGFTECQIDELEKMCVLKDGLILVCGPTGSGKSTTAAAMLERIRVLCKDTKKIISLEDPPEYILNGVTQVQIQQNNENDFADVLRSTLRQDPDVIFIGEIRDSVTAKTAVQAALTGHLVVATIHVGSISQAVLRLYDLNADSRIVNSVLKGIIIQQINNGKMSANIRLLSETKIKNKLQEAV